MQKRSFTPHDPQRPGQDQWPIFRPDNLWMAYDGRLDGMHYPWATFTFLYYRSWANWAELSVWDTDRYIVWEGKINGK